MSEIRVLMKEKRKCRGFYYLHCGSKNTPPIQFLEMLIDFYNIWLTLY